MRAQFCYYSYESIILLIFICQKTAIVNSYIDKIITLASHCLILEERYSNHLFLKKQQNLHMVFL